MQSSAFPIENFPTVLLHLQHQSLQSIVLGSDQTAWGWREIFVSLHQFRSPNTQRLKKKGVLVLSKAMIIRIRIFLKPDLFYPNRPSVQTKSVKLLIDAASFWNHSPEYVFVLYCFVLLLFFFFGTDGFANSCRQLKPDYFEFNWVYSFSLMEFVWNGPKWNLLRLWIDMLSTMLWWVPYNAELISISNVSFSISFQTVLLRLQNIFHDNLAITSRADRLVEIFGRKQ